jgi:hypothetical protein
VTDETEDDFVMDGNASPHEPGVSTLRHDCYPVLHAVSNDARNLFSRSWPQNKR